MELPSTSMTSTRLPSPTRAAEFKPLASNAISVVGAGLAPLTREEVASHPPPSLYSAPTAPAVASETHHQTYLPSNEAKSLLTASVEHTASSKPKGTTRTQTGMNGGRWTEQEHQSFLAGLRLYGREWKKVASKIKTRTSAQIRSHAQKYFAKMARDDEARKQGGLLQHLHGDGNGTLSASLTALGSPSQLLYGYMSDDGSSVAAGNQSGDEGGDTDSTSSQRSAADTAPAQRSLAAIHPFPSLNSTAASAITSLLKPLTARPSSTTLQPAAASAISSAAPHISKKRTRPASTAKISSAPLGGARPNHSMKQRKTTHSTEPAISRDRLPSPEELLEKVSPTVRQRLASLIEAEISALQVLSCYTWLRPEMTSSVPQNPTAPPQPHRSASVTLFPASSPMSLAMITTEHPPSIY